MRFSAHNRTWGNWKVKKVSNDTNGLLNDGQVQRPGRPRDGEKEPISAQQLRIGRRIEQAIRERGLSIRQEVVPAIGKSSATVYKWMDGTHAISAEDLEKLAGLTGKPVVWFYGGDDVAEMAERIDAALTEIMFRLQGGGDLGDAVEEAVRAYGPLPAARKQFYSRRSADLREWLRRQYSAEWDRLTSADRERLKQVAAEMIEKRRSGAGGEERHGEAQ